jgi:hypothetical protein
MKSYRCCPTLLGKGKILSNSSLGIPTRFKNVRLSCNS